MKEIELKSISASKLNLYLTCPRQYYYAYGEGIFQKETNAMLFGSYIHAVLEDYLKRLLKTCRPQDLEGLYSLASEKKKEYETIPETGSCSFFEADVVLNRFASKKIDPEKIYAVEKFFRLPFAGMSGIDIEGRFDRIDIEYPEGEGNLLHIIDYKTGKDKLTESELKHDLQMKFYISGAYLLYRKQHKRFRFSLYYLRDNTEVSFETGYNDAYQKELAGHTATMLNDKKFKKNIARHCFHCPAFKICKPDRSKIKK